jgi:hypothetical protein
MDRHRLVPLCLLCAVFVIGGCQSSMCVTKVLSAASEGVKAGPAPMDVNAGSEDQGKYPCSRMRTLTVHVDEKDNVIVHPERIRVKTGQCVRWQVVPGNTTITRINFIDTREEADAARKPQSTHRIGRLICTGALRECGVFVALDTGRYYYQLDVEHNGRPLSGDPEIEVSCSCP